ncbi:MAG: hypothetical protein CSA42_01875 [Gammaproteobacteria bacterium]|nr:MAG: hypothetical protein CSA42_01875 [Gammaproteobacteria bacterium]
MNINMSFIGILLALIFSIAIFFVLYKTLKKLATETDYAGVKKLLNCLYVYMVLIVMQLFIKDEANFFVLLTLISFIVFWIALFAFKEFAEDVITRFKKDNLE